MTDLPLPPDLATLREHALDARDGALIGGIRTTPVVFCTVHWQTMLTLIDSVTPERIGMAHGLIVIERTAGELNHAIAHQLDRSTIVGLSGRLVRQLHDLTERTAA